MPSLGLKLRLSNITSLIASVYTTGLQMWHKFTATTWTGSNRLPDSSPIGTNTAALYTGRGLSFDGINDVVTIGDTGVTVKTVVFYAYPDSTTTAFMQLQSTGAVRIEISSGTLSATGFTTPTLYVNGAASSTVAATTWQQIAVTSATGVSASNVLLGQSNTTYYGGDLSNVKMFSVQLSAGQIAELYANPEQALPTGVSAGELVGWWMLSNSNFTIPAGVVKIAGSISGATSINSVISPVSQLAIMGQNTQMYFDGINDYIDTGIGTTTPTSQMTLMLYGICTKANSTIIAKGNTNLSISLGYAFYFNGGGNITIQKGNGATYQEASATAGSKLNELAMWAITWDASNFYFYKNGALNNTVARTSTGETSLSTKMLIGTLSTTIFWPFKGAIVSCAVWDKKLTDSELLEIYNNINTINLTANTTTYLSSSNLQAWYKNMGISNSNWSDLSGKGNNGTVNGSPALTYINEGYAGFDAFGVPLQNINTGQIILSGTDYANISDAASLDITSAITLEAWVKPFTVSALQSAIGKNNAYALNITAGAKLQFQRWSGAASGTVSSTASLAANTWYHIAATYNGTTTILYINGAQDTSSGAITGAIDATATDVLMGALTSSTNLFSGYLDSVKVYNQVLTAGQIAGNYNAERSAYS